MGSQRRDLLWVGLGALGSVLLVLVGYDELMSLHFRAWQLYDSTESTEPLAEALRPAIAGWYQPVVLLIGLVAGGIGAYRAIRGHWRPLVFQALLLVVALAAIELTQQYGQQATPTSEVNVVPTLGLIWAALLGVVPLGALLLGAAGLRSTDR